MIFLGHYDVALVEFVRNWKFNVFFRDAILWWCKILGLQNIIDIHQTTMFYVQASHVKDFHTRFFECLNNLKFQTFLNCSNFTSDCFRH